MPKYLNYLQKISNPRTFQRKYDYFKYNYGKLFFSKKNIGSVMEIGPGLGEFIFYLNSLGVDNIDVVDNDDDILGYIKSKFKIRKTFKSENIYNVEKDLDVYDVIVLTQVLEHIPRIQYRKFLTTLYDHLRGGGTLIITVPNMANPFTICERYTDLTHYNGFTDISLKELVDYCEFKTATAYVKGFNIPPYSLINLMRIVFQKLLHGIILASSIINGGSYSKFLTPNITLIVRKK